MGGGEEEVLLVLLNQPVQFTTTCMPDTDVRVEEAEGGRDGGGCGRLNHGRPQTSLICAETISQCVPLTV